MLRTKKAKKVLTAKEQKHLTEAGVHNMAAFYRTRCYHLSEKNAGRGEPCYDCRRIAVKLGMEE